VDQNPQVNKNLGCSAAPMIASKTQLYVYKCELNTLMNQDLDLHLSKTNAQE